MIDTANLTFLATIRELAGRGFMARKPGGRLAFAELSRFSRRHDHSY